MLTDPDAVRVLCFGDSNTYGTCRSDSSTFGTPTNDPDYIRLSTTGEDALSYIIGAYYQHEAIFNSTENQF